MQICNSVQEQFQVVSMPKFANLARLLEAALTSENEGPTLRVSIIVALCSGPLLHESNGGARKSSWLNYANA